MAGIVWAVMAVIGCVVGALCSTTTLAIITGVAVLCTISLAWMGSKDYGFRPVLLGVLWWMGMFLVPMWLLALIHWFMVPWN